MKAMSILSYAMGIILLIFATAIGEGLTTKAYQVMSLGVINLGFGFVLSRFMNKELSYARRNNRSDKH